MSKIKFYSFHIVAILALVVLGVAPPCAAVDVTGYWQGSWTSYDSDSGGLNANMTQSGTILGGNLTIYGTECGTFSNLPLSGTVIGNSITIYASGTCYLDNQVYSLGFTQGTVNGNSISSGVFSVSGPGYSDSGTFSLTRAVNIITASAGAGGAIVPTGTVYVNAGSDQTFQINPNAGYRVLDVVVDGASVGAQTSYTFYNLSSNHTIAATFTLNTHTITASAGPGGSISPSGSVTVQDGSSPLFLLTPDPGYRVVSILYDGTLYEWSDPQVYVLTVHADHTLQVLFERIGVNPGIPLLLLDE